MEKAVPGNVTVYINRRLHPVRLGIGHLNKLLEGTKSGTMLNVNRDLLVSIASTLELFIEDFEIYSGSDTHPGYERKTSEKAGDTPRVTQSRVT